MVPTLLRWTLIAWPPLSAERSRRQSEAKRPHDNAFLHRTEDLMFERYTERARQVIVLAQQESRELAHNYIGTEHILLGLLAEEHGIGAQVLNTLDVTLDKARKKVVA